MRGSSTVILFAFASLAASQFHYNKTDSTFSCTNKSGLAAYCAGNEIIIRCSNGIGLAGNCNDILAGEKPTGASVARCYQSTPSSGDAACSKAGLVYPATGAGDNSLSDPYPIPVSNRGAVANMIISPPLATGTGSPVLNSNDTAPRLNATTTYVIPKPVATAGTTTTITDTAQQVSSSTVSPPSVTGGTGLQTHASTKPYWAFAAFAVFALL